MGILNKGGAIIPHYNANAREIQYRNEAEREKN